MRLNILAATFLLGAGLAQAQVVSPLGGSTGNAQSAPPATRVPAAPMSRSTTPVAPMTVAPTTVAPTTAAPTTAAPSTATAPGTTGVPGTTAAPGATATPGNATAPRTTAERRGRRSIEERFTAANTTHDGKLTLEQARSGRLRAVARDFDQIDSTKRGYVTIEEIKAHQSSQRAARRAAREQKPAATH